MGWEVGGKFKEEGTYVYLWLIHVDIWQKPTQYCKAIILQLKINKLKKKKYTVNDLTYIYYKIITPISLVNIHFFI